MTLICDWNPYISPRAGQSWPYIVDHLTLAGEEKENALIALILQNSDIQEKTARNYLSELNRHGFLRQPERGTYGLRHQPHRKDTPMINPNDSAHVRSLNPTDTALSSSDVRPSTPAQDAQDAPGATQSPFGYRSDPPALNGPQRGAERVSDAEAAEWARLAAEATEGPWVVDPDGSIGAPMAGFVCGEDGHPRLDCSECGTRVCHVNVIPGDPDAAFIAESRTAVPRLLAEREALRAEVERLHGQAKVEDVFYLDMCQERDHERAMCAERTAERDRARSLAARLEAENARMVEWNAITTRAFETTRRVLQEASGLPDDIDDPDCRDEMVLALRPRAEKAEAEVARLREGIEALSDEMQSDTCPACHAFYADEGSTTWGCDHTEGMQHAGDMLRALLAEGGE